MVPEPLGHFRLIWCDDVPATVEQLRQEAPDAVATFHPSEQYAELEHEQGLLAIAATDMMRRRAPRAPTT